MLKLLAETTLNDQLQKVIAKSDYRRWLQKAFAKIDCKNWLQKEIVKCDFKWFETACKKGLQFAISDLKWLETANKLLSKINLKNLNKSYHIIQETFWLQESWLAVLRITLMAMKGQKFKNCQKRP